MDMARVWPIICQFGVGGVLCLIGILAGLRSGYISPNSKDDRRILMWVAGGFLGLLLLSCAFTFWLPFVGGGNAP